MRGGPGEGQQQQCKARERGQQPAVFYKLPFKRNQQRDGGGGERREFRVPALDCAGMYSPCRRCVTVARANAQKTHKTSGISFDTGAGTNKCGAMGTSKAPPPIDAYLEIGPVSVVYLASNPCVCRKKRKTTLQDVVYIKVLA